MRTPIDNRKAIIPVRQNILNAVQITIHSHNPDTLIDPETINSDHMSENFCFLNKIPTEDLYA